MGDLNKNTKYFTGTMMVRPRPGVNIFEASDQCDWELCFFPEDVRLVNCYIQMNKKARTTKTRQLNAETRFELTHKVHQNIVESLKED